MDYFKRKVLAIQEGTLLLGGTMRAVVTKPRYTTDTLIQMDIIGVGSLPIVLLTGFFTGAVLALQSYRSLARFGEVGLLGEMVALSAVLELGPVLAAVVVAGRNASGIASELGSMVVSEQVDALRAMGTDPVRKLVAPRVVAMLVMVPLLTIMADFIALVGGSFIAVTVAHLTSAQFWSSAYQNLDYHDITQGMIKPVLFALVIAIVGCYFGLSTTGGTEGVGRSTTAAVMISIVLIIIIDFLVTQLLIGIGFA